MNPRLIPLSALLLLITLMAPCLPATAHAAGSLLRIACDGEDVGAEVQINGKFRGECPVDLTVPEGLVKLRVVKNPDADHEQVFELQLRIGEGSVKKVEVQLPPPSLTARAQQAEDTRSAAEAEAARVKADLATAQFNRHLAAANGGNVNGMLMVGYSYGRGLGVEKDAAESAAWYQKARRAGSDMGAFLLTRRYKSRTVKGKFIDVDAAHDVLLLPKENLRQVGISGALAIHAFAASDPFFAMPDVAAPSEITYDYQRSLQIIGSNQVVAYKTTCTPKGRFFSLNSEMTATNVSASIAEESALGGLFSLTTDVSFGWLKPGRHAKAGRLISVYGQPFPLVPGKRFGFAYEVDEGPGQQARVDISCAAGVKGGRGDEMVCLYQTELSGEPVAQIRRWTYHGPSGCLFGGNLE